MLNRRQFFEKTLKTSSLIAFGSVVPGFLANTARAASPGQDTILVVLELAGGNDGLNTVIPYADDAYQKARSSLRLAKEEVVRIDDQIGLNPGLRSFDRLLGKGQLAILQGVGYPNPNRSHFEGTKIWQSADPKLQTGTGWLGRGLAELPVGEGQIPGMFLGTEALPLALQGSATGVPTINPNKPYDLNLGGQPFNPGTTQGFAVPTTVSDSPPGPAPKTPPTPADKHRAMRRHLIQDLTQQTNPPANSMLQFVQRSAVQTYASIDRLKEITAQNQDQNRYYFAEIGQRNGVLGQNLGLVARMIQAGFGTRVFYLSISGFDTHSTQKNDHQNLLREVADAVTNFFTLLENNGNAQRVLLMTFSEFGRRVQENSSKGTDHGAASCLFVAGPGVKGGLIGAHPSLTDLDDGDLKHHTDFRQVYATLLDNWLHCDSRSVLGSQFTHVPLLRA